MQHLLSQGEHTGANPVDSRVTVTGSHVPQGEPEFLGQSIDTAICTLITMLALAHGISGVVTVVVAVSGRHEPKARLVVLCCGTGALSWDVVMAGIGRVPSGWLDL
jgi:uncharacterized membrane protein HdeD (DUF308 family)